VGRASAAEKAMTERDSDIEFDFFEDLEPDEPTPPEESQRGQRPPRGGPPRRPVRGPTGIAPLLRLAGLIAFAILVVILLVFWVQSCRGASKKHSYETYMEKARGIGRDSTQIGTELTNVLTTPGLKALQMQTKIDGLAQRMEQLRTAGAALSSPGPLRNEQQSLVETLDFRVSGLRGLADTFRKTAGSKDVDKGGRLLATQANRLVAGDVVWADLFRLAALSELQRQGITGVAVPTSSVVNNPDFGSPRFWVPILERISGASTGGTTGGTHGTGIITTKVLPSGQELSTSTETTVTAGPDLGFVVVVEDTGDSQEVQIEVTLTIQQQPNPIVKTQTIALINPGEQKQVVFHNLGTVTFATKTTVKVDVKPVPNEASTTNNSASYPVIFSLG
jgi:hypothetical protein